MHIFKQECSVENIQSSILLKRVIQMMKLMTTTTLHNNYDQSQNQPLVQNRRFVDSRPCNFDKICAPETMNKIIVMHVKVVNCCFHFFQLQQCI